MKINNFSGILFQKKLAARCAIKNGERKKYCNIFQLEPKKDKDYFKKLNQTEQWQDAYFVKVVDSQLQEYQFNQKKFYVIEGLDEECLGYCSVDTTFKNKDEISYIETSPKNSYENKDRKLKYIGETLLVFLMGMARKANKKMLYVPYILDNARSFYFNKCNFERDSYPNAGIMRSQDFYRLEEQNYRHTHAKCALLADKK